jgi:hypothetical protein
MSQRKSEAHDDNQGKLMTHVEKSIAGRPDVIITVFILNILNTGDNVSASLYTRKKF